MYGSHGGSVIFTSSRLYLILLSCVRFQSRALDPRRSFLLTAFALCPCFVPSFQRLPNGPSSGLEDSELERQREGEIERQRAELSQLRERLALMCRQVRADFLSVTTPLLSAFEPKRRSKTHCCVHSKWSRNSVKFHNLSGEALDLR